MWDEGSGMMDEGCGMWEAKSQTRCTGKNVNSMEGHGAPCLLVPV